MPLCHILTSLVAYIAALYCWLWLYNTETIAVYVLPVMCYSTLMSCCDAIICYNCYHDNIICYHF